MKWTTAGCIACIILFACAAHLKKGPAPAATVRPLRPHPLSLAESAIRHAIADAEIPGAVLLIGIHDRILYRKAFGHRFRPPLPLEEGRGEGLSVRPEPMTEDTLFDLASLTKPIATATSITKLIDQRKLRPTDRIASYIPEFAANGKQDITVEQLLLHTSGLIPDNPLDDYASGPFEALQRIYNLSPQFPPGTRFQYSDVGYIVLGELIHRIDGRPLDRFATQEIFTPLGMKDTGFNPPADRRSRIAPTEQRDGYWLRGEVHDPRAAALGGVAGHAGLFGTADDVARFCQMILGSSSSSPPWGEGGAGGSIYGEPQTHALNAAKSPLSNNSIASQVLSPLAVALMTRPRGPADDCRSYGFDINTPYSSCRGLRFPVGSFGHTGFTGTMLWIDPAHDLFFILLTSRLQMPGGGANKTLRSAVATYVAQAALGADDKQVLTGIDALINDDFKPLNGRRVGLITNQTGLDRFGRRTIDLLHRATGVTLVSIFSPEHGATGKLDQENIASAKDDKTGLPVHSLYGQTRRPTPEMLADIDTLVFDIQDVGTRFYTYLTTMGYAMEEAAAHGKRFIVLDRPNPIMPLGPRGPLADGDKLSFIAYKPLPITHGMTLGELARLIQGQHLPKLDLKVIQMQHYRRDIWWEDTGLQWVNPSPNMRSPAEALLYPGIGLLEMSNLSVGRGTDKPFEQIGAPWIDSPRLAAALTAASLPGVRFDPSTFTPDSSAFAHEKCNGLSLTITDRKTFNPIRTALTIAWHLRRLHGEKFDYARIQKMLANDATYQAWLTTPDPSKLPLDPSSSFLQQREKYLIYK